MGLSFEKLLVILVIAAIIVGPDRLPAYAQRLSEFVRYARRAINNSKQQLKHEFGEDVDWRQYDPRQYDPRKIIRDAILADEAAEQAEKERQAGRARAAALPVSVQIDADGQQVQAPSFATVTAAPHVPFDSEAT